MEDRNYFTEIVASVSDLCFTRDGKYIITRDYCTVKFWDVAMPREPVRSITVQNFPEPKLHELYEGEYVFDKFGVAVSGSGEHIMTGSYSNLTSVFDANGETETTIEVRLASGQKWVHGSHRKSGCGAGVDTCMNTLHPTLPPYLIRCVRTLRFRCTAPPLLASVLPAVQGSPATSSYPTR